MIDKCNLTYFLYNIKDELNFTKSDDFINRVCNDFNFRFKVQKFVFLAKYFGWNNSYKYALYSRGPYSSALANDYYSSNLFEYNPVKIKNFNMIQFKNFIKDKSDYYLEATSTILYFKSFKKNFSLNCALKTLNEIKPHINQNIVKKAYYDVCDFNSNLDLISDVEYESVINIKSDLQNKIIETMNLFEQFDVNYNKFLILGSLDYLRIVLREEQLEHTLKWDLLDLIINFLDEVLKVHDYCKNDSELFEKINLEHIESLFNRLGNYISTELNVLPKFDDEKFDLKLCYWE